MPTRRRWAESRWRTGLPDLNARTRCDESGDRTGQQRRCLDRRSYSGKRLPELAPTIASGRDYMAAARSRTSTERLRRSSPTSRSDTRSSPTYEAADGRIWLRHEGTQYCCGDLSEQRAAARSRRQDVRT